MDVSTRERVSTCGRASTLGVRAQSRGVFISEFNALNPVALPSTVLRERGAAYCGAFLQRTPALAPDPKGCLARPSCDTNLPVCVLYCVGVAAEAR